MTGRELANHINRVKGRVAVPVVLGDVKYYVYAHKTDLAATLTSIGDRETRLALEAEPGGYFLRELD